MKHKQHGFALLEAIIAGLIIMIIALAAGVVWSRHQATLNDDGSTAPAGTVEVQVYNGMLNQTLDHRPVMIYWDNGVRCIKAPCDESKVKSWRGTTDRRGIVHVPKSQLVDGSTVSVDGFQPAAIPYSKKQAHYKVLLSPSSNGSITSGR